MVDIHPSVGHLTLTGKVLLGLADSDDPGEQPDAGRLVADITITPSIDYVVVVADESVIALPPKVSASLNAAGQLVAPADGKGETGTSTSLQLIAPDQAAIHRVGWRWVIDIAPVDGVSFKPIQVFLSGAPGDQKTLGGLILAGQVPSLDVYPSWIEVEDATYDEPTNTWTADIPDDTPLGTLVIWRDADDDLHAFLYQ